MPNPKTRCGEATESWQSVKGPDKTGMTNGLPRCRFLGCHATITKKRLRGRLMPKGPKIFWGVRFAQWRKHLPFTDVTRVHLSQPRSFMWVKFVFSSRPCSKRFFSEQFRIQGRPNWDPKGPKNVFARNPPPPPTYVKGTPVLSTFS